ncbi:YpfB family protein [Anoxybacillus kestanbolensis]|uniref:YpfB family protein n=1 Tax=Anoxybacillus kestanbolensis TaxID=227476 RepID=UPI003D21A83F
MKTVERMLWKLAIIQFIFLCIAQLIVSHSSFAPYIVKVIHYEGVIKNSATKTIETFDQR